MRCGKGHDHATITEVRACYGIQASGIQTSAQVHVTRAPRQTGDHRTNRYPDNCIECGCTVAAQAGILFRSPGVGSQRLGEGQWLVRHLPGQCDEARDLAAIKTMVPRRSTAKADFTVIQQGYYATRKESGIGVDFWFVREGTEKWDGYRFVKRVIGGQPNQRIHTTEQIKALHAIIKMGVEESGNLFADEMGECKWCRSDLTRKASRELRCGSTCAENHGIGLIWAELDKKYGHE